MSNKRIGILTGGGDVPGLNSVIKSVVYSASAQPGYEVIGLRRGWEALTHMDISAEMDPDYVLPLDRINTRSIDRYGGTFLHTSRTKPSKMKADRLPDHVQARLKRAKELGDGLFDLTPLVLENIERLKLDWLVAIGGDDTLSYAAELNRQGFPVVAVPKTMDNDVRNTEYCIGFSTALTRASDAITRQRTTIGSHERIGVFRIFGRDAGFTALYTAYVTSARCCIPEVEFDVHKVIDLLVADKRSNPSRYALIILSEGATWKGYQLQEYGEPDAYGHRKKVSVAEAFAEAVKQISGEECIVSDLTYDLRSGEPAILDRMVATTFANMAVECILANGPGRMMAIRNGCYTDTDIPDPELGPRTVDVANMYNVERFRPSYKVEPGTPIFLTRV
ncbi:MAG TPA: 6-phosphofructokinase [Phycisphaerae bacterium]|jgi:6-phosphofructokinase|nr:6-phosphofructokinase [Phycisphaerae bacterium]HOB72947.1 6-phosphofructokinase [Phycisphaerae bacterium]HOJ53004.1 6-phosphofructokinase [Phycisphaerae bacterium]HOL24741.1 6-phosphofructokinase [Phycisphaerae bacterium]HPP19277.1 6-phosphofructokinase [Phycisphaerae bacterium]